MNKVILMGRLTDDRVKQIMSVPCVIFHCPQDLHILTGCPPDLVRYESTEPNHHFAMIKSRKMCDRYAPKNPSGYPAVVYKICTLTQWNEYWNEQNQLTLDLEGVKHEQSDFDGAAHS